MLSVRDALVRRVDCMVFSPVKKRGRPRRILEKLIKMDLMVNKISKSLVFNQANDIGNM